MNEILLTVTKFLAQLFVNFYNVIIIVINIIIQVCENKSINYTFINTICNIVGPRQYHNIENVKKLMSSF